LPSVPTWWCGDEDGRRHVLAHLDDVVIKPISRGLGPTSVFPWELAREARDDLRRRIESYPAGWVGQEPIELASAPTLTTNGLEARRTVLRAFAVARNDSYSAMPGGLTRVAGSDGSSGSVRAARAGMRVSNQAGAISKDTWVLASEPEKLSGFWLATGPAVAAVDPEASMSSRAAENLFWLGRYAERAETMARLVRAAHDRRDFQRQPSNPAGTECLEVLLAAITYVSSTYPGFVGDGGAARVAAPGAELFALVVDDERHGTLAHAVKHLLSAARAVRDQLSTDTWLVVADLDREIRDLRTSDPEHPMIAQHTLGRIMQSLLALSGLAGESMVRDPGWRFMDAGRRIERALQLAALLRTTVTAERNTATDSLLIESVLIAVESIITYRRRYRSHAQLETLLDLLVFDGDNPRSVAYQLDQLAADVRLIPRLDRGPRLSEAQRLVLETSTALGLAESAQLARTQGDGIRSDLDEFLTNLLELLSRTADAIDSDHFVHLLPQHSLVSS